MIEYIKHVVSSIFIIIGQLATNITFKGCDDAGKCQVQLLCIIIYCLVIVPSRTFFTSLNILSNSNSTSLQLLPKALLLLLSSSSSSSVLLNNFSYKNFH